MPMERYVARRLLLFVPTLLLLSLVVFLFLRLIPGDPAIRILTGTTGEGRYTQEALDNLRHELGTDKSLPAQYGTWVWNLLHGDLGTSYQYSLPVSRLIKPRLYLTLELAGLGIFISFLLAVPLGVVSALTRNSLPDYVARFIATVGLSVPTFIVGLVTLYLLVRVFNWLPPLDYSPPWEDLGSNLTQLIFPAITVALFTMAFIARVTRSSMLEVLREDYIRTARAKGLRESRVLFTHALKNAFAPVLTVTGWAFGVLLGGTVIIENIFVLPGMGSLLLDAIVHRDYPLIESEVFVIAGMVLFLNLVIDLLYGWLDPRIRYG